jgi:peptidoglycan hydrolase-like protein with peptidoglycan-binding domain
VPSGDGAAPPARARRRGLAGVALLVVAAVIVVVTIVATGKGKRKTGGSPRIAAGATTVERRNLVTSQDDSGKISYAGSSTIANRLEGTLTWVPAVGRVIYTGQKLFDVDNFPVTLMKGTTPAYRTLESSDPDGPDVQQLNTNLIDLGFNPDGIVDDDEWQAATTAGVEAFQEANGVPETGKLTLGTVVFLRGAQRVASLESGATSVSDGLPEAPTGDDEFVDYSPTTTTSGTSTTSSTDTTPPATTTETTSTPPPQPTDHPSNGALKRAETSISRLRQQVQQLERQNHQLGQELNAAKSHKADKPSDSGSSGPVSGGSSPVMTTTSTTLVVSVDVSAGEQSMTRVGARVPVVMPSGSTVPGRVVKIGQATSSGGGNSTVAITIHLDKRENGRNLDQATVSVKFVQKTARHVLSVPITALLARPGGKYAVQEAKAPHTLIDVTTGTFATGYVQIAGKGLYAGLKVTDSQG